LLTLTRWLSSASRAGDEDYRRSCSNAWVQERPDVGVSDANRLLIACGRESINSRSSRVGVTVDENVLVSATA
jgi:hypothetical protein